jgi:hypothetical protein
VSPSTHWHRDGSFYDPGDEGGKQESGGETLSRENHGFSRRSVATLDDSDAFFKRHLATQPTTLPEGLINEVAVEFDEGRSADREEK